MFFYALFAGTLEKVSLFGLVQWKDLKQVSEKNLGFVTISEVICGLVKSTIILQELQT